MIILVHNNKQVTRVINSSGAELPNFSQNIGVTLFTLADEYPEETLVWCHELAYPDFNPTAVEDSLHHDRMIVSFNPGNTELLGSSYGYVDHANILRIPKNVSYPTWQISSVVGAAKAKLLKALDYLVPVKEESFDYLLQSLGWRLSYDGLFCLSEPRLLNQTPEVSVKPVSKFVLFRFVKQHKGLKWIGILFLNMLIYERRIPILPIICACFFKRRPRDSSSFDSVTVSSTKNVVQTGEVDVIIPTIGRTEHLHNVLRDLRNQTHLPKKVVVVEQNPASNSISQLDFIANEKWPFEIDHTFTHQSGACNARNVALGKVTSEWVFMCDDDNRFGETLIEEVLKNAAQFGVEAVLTAYPTNDQVNDYPCVHQTPIFGAGNAFVKSDYLDKVRFDMRYEFGYGEDFDFGMQLRSIGADVVYFPNPAILHLKAPMGGFRIKPVFPWSEDSVKPIPSPTILLNYLKYQTREQFSAYKTIFVLKSLRKSLTGSKKGGMANWNSSLRWAQKLLNCHEV